MSVVIVKYNSGNLRSVQYAFKRLGIEAEVSADPERIRMADRVVFPGQGEASSTMEFLRNSRLDQVLLGLKQPFLGICLGLQILCTSSEEGNTKCLGLVDCRVRRFSQARKIPQIGWNSIDDLSGPLFKGIRESEYFYFVHSYFAEESKATVARCNYEGEVFSAALSKENLYGVQFHPEKSGDAGEQVLRNFMEL